MSFLFFPEVLADTSCVEFYQGKPGNSGSLGDIWLFEKKRLENDHYYIQWLFPTERRSDWNIVAPVLTKEDIEQFRNCQDLKERLLKSLRLMLSFYNLKLEGTSVEPVISADVSFPDKSRNWLRKNNHNHLRLTRIMDSLTTLGLAQYAKALFKCLMEIRKANSKGISEKTFQCWCWAVHEEPSLYRNNTVANTPEIISWFLPEESCCIS